MRTDSFALRHIGPKAENLQEMLDTIGVESIEQLIYETIPDDIRLENPLNLPKAMSENQYAEHIKKLSEKNKLYKTYIGLGYHQSILPAVIQRNILENPGWYTAYTPYQAEIAQGRLEALLNFQTMVSDLTGMELANASLLDESTAAAEAMALLFSVRERNQKKANVNKFFVSQQTLPQTISLMETRANFLGIDMIVGDHEEFNFSEEYFGALVQYPGKFGQIFDYKEFVENCKAANIKTAFAADILSLVMLQAPGELGVDVVVGTTQRFGIPLGYGGPHAAFFATREEFKRNLPGRIIGLTKDVDGNNALRMALQTREQHIKRDKATSNICTAQVLLAVMAGMYAVYHGPRGLEYIAGFVHATAVSLEDSLKKLGFEQQNSAYFDTLHVKVDAKSLKTIAEKHEINFFYPDSESACISINETTTTDDLNAII